MGPNTNDESLMRKLVQNGMDIARFNFSHGDHEEQKGRMDMLKKIREEENKPIAILLDTKGSFSNDLNELKETLKAYAPNEANVSLRGDLPITVETTSRTFLLSCPSADDAYVLLLHSNGKVERVLKGPAAV